MSQFPDGSATLAAPTTTTTGRATSDATRGARAEMCNELLVDAIELMLQAKYAHWNVAGPHFAALHPLFDKVFAGALEHVDGLAERVVQLGGCARGTLQAVARASKAIGDLGCDAASWREHVRALSIALSSLSARAVLGVERAEELGDPVTADLMTQIARSTDEHRWLVEAHLREEA